MYTSNTIQCNVPALSLLLSCQERQRVLQQFPATASLQDNEAISQLLGKAKEKGTVVEGLQHWT